VQSVDVAQTSVATFMTNTPIVDSDCVADHDFSAAYFVMRQRR